MLLKNRLYKHNISVIYKGKKEKAVCYGYESEKSLYDLVYYPDNTTVFFLNMTSIIKPDNNHKKYYAFIKQNFNLN